MTAEEKPTPRTAIEPVPLTSGGDHVFCARMGQRGAQLPHRSALRGPPRARRPAIPRRRDRRGAGVLHHDQPS